MKNLLIVLLASMTLTACKLPIHDETFQDGLKVLNVDGSPSGKSLYFNINDPKWEVAQWHSKTNIANANPQIQSNGSVIWGNPEKWIQIGPAGSMDNDITLAINTDYSYSGIYRKKTDPKDWPHLYISQNIGANQDLFLSKFAQINLNFQVKLEYSNHIVKSGYDRNIHGAEYLIYFTVQNLKGNHTTNPRYGKYFWFGVPIYDVRDVNIPKFITRIDTVTESYMYKMPYNAIAKKSVHSREWVQFSADILPFIKQALSELNSKGVDIGPINELKLGLFLFGWEVTGLYIGTMKLRGLNLAEFTAEDLANLKK